MQGLELELQAQIAMVSVLPYQLDFFCMETLEWYKVSFPA